MKNIQSLLNKQISFKQVALLALLLVLPLIFVACTNQASASNSNAQTAAQKWGASPDISNYYEYEQMIQVYQERDNPNLVMNAYLYNAMSGDLTCLGRVKGFGVPYGTEMSPPDSTGQGSVPEPNGLYPSQSTSADWVQLIDPKTGKTYITFVEPDLIITQATLPCKPLGA